MNKLRIAIFFAAALESTWLFYLCKAWNASIYFFLCSIPIVLAAYLFLCISTKGDQA